MNNNNNAAMLTCVDKLVKSLELLIRKSGPGPNLAVELVQLGPESLELGQLAEGEA